MKKVLSIYYKTFSTCTVIFKQGGNKLDFNYTTHIKNIFIFKGEKGEFKNKNDISFFFLNWQTKKARVKVIFSVLSKWGLGVVLVKVGSATSLNCQIRAPNNHTLSRSIFPHLRKPSCKVYSLIPGPLCYKRAEDPGLFSLQSLSLLIRETQTLEDNSRLGSVKGRRKRMILKKKKELKREWLRHRWKDNLKERKRKLSDWK